jgi:pheromone shutdown protein TraB
MKPAHAVALVGIMAATMECGKLALSFLPNIEIVTLLHALYGYAFGYLGIVASVVFVFIEPLIYGFGTWVPTYFLYWPLVAAVFWLLSRLKVKNRWLITAVAVLLTIWFGVLSSLVEIGLFSGFFDDFFKRFSVYYLRGIPFYLAQTVTNAVLFPLLFRFVSARLSRLRTVFYT